MVFKSSNSLNPNFVAKVLGIITSYAYSRSEFLSTVCQSPSILTY
nr:MAG TPA: hypothetical protein [Bacteriophage sp.]